MGRVRGLFAVLALALTPAAPASAELVAKGDLFVRFDGGIAPHALPRDSLAPIAVRIEGKVKTPSGESPPALRRIEVALNSGGRLSTRGLPVCPRDRIELATASEALAACGPALVGGGGFTARTTLSGQSPTRLSGEILLFNSVSRGRPVALAHISQGEPVSLNRVVVFRIRRTRGTYGTVITAQLPEDLNRNGSLESIFLQLQRRYTFRGSSRAYLSASCAAPAGFPGAVFPFARVSMSFADGRTLSATLTRNCRVR